MIPFQRTGKTAVSNFYRMFFLRKKLPNKRCSACLAVFLALSRAAAEQQHRAQRFVYVLKFTYEYQALR